ncbi:preprotein translocase subunit SecY [Patescibacteria group bacterium]
MNKLLKNREVRNKILFSLFAIAIFRFLTRVPVPGVDLEAVKSFLSGSAFFSMFDLFSGGGFQNFSIVTLGLGPYISASIIVQMFSKIIPSLEELMKEGEAGREKINLYTKLLTVPLCLIQGYSVYFLLNRQGIIEKLPALGLTTLLFTLIGGSMILIWLGDLVTEYGVGQGISLLIFAGIVSRLPQGVINFLDLLNTQGLIIVSAFLVLVIVIIAGVVLVNEGTRNIPLEYGRRGVRTQKVTNTLPIKINQAGVMPIIFAVALVQVPSILGGPLQVASNPFLQKFGFFLSSNFSPQTLLYNLLYFLLVFGFTFFYTFSQFDPEKIADDVKKRGGFVPGIRPGRTTSKFLKDIVLKLTLVGALFLGLIAILPYIISSTTGIANLTVGGTSLLIMVSVVLDTIRQVESMLVTRNYQSFLD